MRILMLPDATWTYADRTYLLCPPFDLKVEGRIIARGTVSTEARIHATVSGGSRLTAQVSTA